MMLCFLASALIPKAAFLTFPLLSQGSKKPGAFFIAYINRGQPRCWISARPRSRSERSCACRSQRQGKVAVTFKGTVQMTRTKRCLN